MTDSERYVNAIGRLRSALAQLNAQGKLEQVNQDRELVLARFQPIFASEHVGQIAEDEFVSFLYFENNKHWQTLFRQRSRLTSDMSVLREALIILMDETRDIAERLDVSLGMAHGLGKAIATAILLVAYPQQYGVWNNVSEGTMQLLGLWPDFPRGTTVGQKYVEVNRLLNQVTKELEVDLWTLDLLWRAVYDETFEEGLLAESSISSEEFVVSPNAQYFGLERHLHEFLRDNWDLTELGAEWMLYTDEAGDEIGSEYHTPVGRIDLLARHRAEPRWLVVELKRNQTGDATMGQILRYIGYVEQHLVKSDEKVEGLIIARQADLGLLYALSTQRNVELKLYEVEFRLKPAPIPDAKEPKM